MQLLHKQQDTDRVVFALFKNSLLNLKSVACLGTNCQTGLGKEKKNLPAYLL